jgi:hypothetical protein
VWSGELALGGRAPRPAPAGDAPATAEVSDHPGPG